MADARLAWLEHWWGVACGMPFALAACAGAPAAPSPSPADPSTTTFGPDTSRMPVYRSHRLAVTLPLPDGKTWRIDDHSQPELVATHAPTRSRVAVAVFRADELVGHTRCEELARERKLVPEMPPGTARVVEDQVTITQSSFDTRIEVVVEPGTGPSGLLAGRVMAFGGFLRKCFAFVYATSVEGSAHEPALSERLAFVRARVLGGLELEPFDVVERSPGPEDVGPRGPQRAPGP